MAYNFGQGLGYFPAPQSGFSPPPTNYIPQIQNTVQSQQTAPQQGFTIRPVASREEAMAIPSDFFGSGIIMPCLGQGSIYLKRFNQNTGLSDLLEFVYAPPQPKQELTGEFVPMNLFQQLAAKVEQLEKGVTANVPNAE